MQKTTSAFLLLEEVIDLLQIVCKQFNLSMHCHGHPITFVKNPSWLADEKSLMSLTFALSPEMTGQPFSVFWPAGHMVFSHVVNTRGGLVIFCIGHNAKPEGSLPETTIQGFKWIQNRLKRTTEQGPPLVSLPSGFVDRRKARFSKRALEYARNGGKLLFFWSGDIEPYDWNYLVEVYDGKVLDFEKEKYEDT